MVLAESSATPFDLIDDFCAHLVFQHLDPYPDRLNVGRVCKADAEDDGCQNDNILSRSANACAPSTQARPVEETAPSKSEIRQCSLSKAISRSRPGDTLLLGAGRYNVYELAVTWPLIIEGAGQRPEDVVILSPPGADTALDFRSSAKLRNVTVCAHRGACVVHRQGSVVLDGCVLHSFCGGLDHLFHPMVTLACTAASGLERAPKMLRARAEGVGVGRLVVADTRIKGGLQAVKCGGSGHLQQVRAIDCPRGALFWFSVDSAFPGFAAPRSGRDATPPNLAWRAYAGVPVHLQRARRPCPHSHGSSAAASTDPCEPGSVATTCDQKLQEQHLQRKVDRWRRSSRSSAATSAPDSSAPDPSSQPPPAAKRPRL